MYVTGAGAWRFPGIGLSVGLGANLVLSSVHTLRARVGDGSDTLVTRTAAGEKLAEGRSRVEVKSTNFSLGGGLIWEPMENLWIGASYQSQPGFGKIQLDGDLEAVLAEQAEASTTKVRLEQELPDVIRLGGRWRPTPSTEVRLNGEFVRWSVFERQCLINMDDPEATDRPTTKDCRLNGDGELMEDRTIVGGDFDGQPLKSNVTQNVERDWEDTLAVRAGGSYWLQENLELYGALGYDGNAVPDERLDPAIPDFHDISLSAGARVELMEKALALAGTYTQFIYFARETDVRDQANKPVFPSATPDAAGKYTRSIGALNVNVEYTF
jgi:long-chain fatty acid transport protein